MTTPITRDELKSAIDAGGVVVVDALGGGYYAEQHLPGAIALVEGEVAELAAAVLPNKDTAIVTYCSDTTCGNSDAVAKRLGDLGYNDVRVYREGIKDWKEAGLPIERA